MSLQISPSTALERTYGVSADELRAAVGSGTPLALASKTSLIDVRDADDYAAWHLPGAVHADYQRQLELFDRTTAAPPGSKRLVFVCYAGVRSGRVARAAAAKGFDASSILGGAHVWRALGLPVVTDEAAPEA